MKRVVLLLVAAISAACTQRALDVPLLSTASGLDGAVSDASLQDLLAQDLSTPFPFSSSIGTAVNGFPACDGWTINVSDRASTSCDGFGGTGFNVFFSGAAPGIYPSVSTIVDACMSQSVWATYAGNDNLQTPMSGTLTVTKVKLGSSTSDTATIDGSYDVTVQDGSGQHFAGDFHAPPCTF